MYAVKTLRSLDDDDRVCCDEVREVRLTCVDVCVSVPSKPQRRTPAAKTPSQAHDRPKACNRLSVEPTQCHRGILGDGGP